MRLRTTRSLALLVTLLGASLIGPLAPAARASTTVVGVSDFAFSRTSVTVAQGNSVTWQFHAEHTTTSNQGFWDSGHRMSGSYVVTFSDAGTFAYHCTMHPSMTGVVKVPLKAAGKASKGYTVTWSTRSSTPSNRRFDVQYKRTGAKTWTNWRSSGTSRSAKFNPKKAGTYAVRARTHNGTRGVSGWSPTLSLKIT